MSESVEIRHEPERSRWAAYVDGTEAAFAEYLLAEDPPRVVFPHTVTHPAHAGRGIASQVVAAALAHVQQEARDGQPRQVVPQCWFVAQHLDRHPELAGLLEPAQTGL